MANEIISSLAQIRYKISNMVCEGCVEKITSLLKDLPGVKAVKANVFQKEIQVNYDSEQIRHEDIKKVLENESYNLVVI
jgi:copper chaperone CopZ